MAAGCRILTSRGQGLRSPWTCPRSGATLSASARAGRDRCGSRVNGQDGGRSGESLLVPGVIRIPAVGGRISFFLFEIKQ